MPDTNLPVEPIPFKTEEAEPSSEEAPKIPSVPAFEPLSPTPEPPPQEASLPPLSAQPPQPEVSEEAKTFLAGGGGSGFLGALKKIFLILLILALLGGIAGLVYKYLLPRLQLTGQKEVTFTYWGLWEEDNIISGIITDYQQDHPNIKINYERQSHKDYRERLQSALARGDGPDVFRFHNTWVPMLKNELASVPAKTFDAASFEATFYPVARNDLRVGSSYVGIPLEIDGLALFVNTEIFKAAAKTVPKTWEDLRRTALELTVKDSQGQIQIAGVALGRTENIDYWSDILALMMLQNGADLTKPDTCVQQAGKEICLGPDALTYFTIFAKVDGVWDKTLPPSTAAFAGGKLAMYFGPSWAAFEIKRASPKLAFEIYPVPQLPETNITWASYWAEGVYSKSKNQEAAWEFLNYLSTKESLQKLYQAASQTRLFGEPYSRVDMAGLLETQPYVGAYVKQAPMARSWYLASRTFDNGLNDKIIQYFEDAVNAVNQGKSAKEALGTTRQGVSQILAQYGLASAVVR